MKKLLSLCMCIVFIVTLLPQAVAAPAPNTEDDLTYAFNEADGTLTISGIGVMIERPWISSKDKIKKVIIEEGVTCVGEKAFEDCTALESVSIPQSATYIVGYAFDGCTALEEITIPESITKIGTGAFQRSGLKSISIPDSVTQLSRDAFYGCTALKSVKLPKYITKIEAWTFYGCTALEEIAIPEGVTEIGDYAFQECTALTTVKLPSSMEIIGWDVFKGCTAIKIINLPYSVSKISHRAFEGCSSLESIIIPPQVDDVFADTFKNCTSLKTVIIAADDEDEKAIGTAFDGCTALEKVVVPETVTYIGEDVFKNCGDVVVYCVENSPIYEYAVANNVKFEFGEILASGTCGDALIWYLDDKGTLTIGGIGDTQNYQYFYDVPWNEYRSEIKKMVIEDGVTGIDSNVISYCSNLTTVVIPKSVKYVSLSANYIEEIYIEDLEAWCTAGSIDACSSNGVKLYLNGEPIVDLVVPDGVPYIGASAFKRCLDIKSVTLPESVKKIYTDAFAWDENIEEFIIKGELEHIGYGAFTRVDKIKEQEGFLIYVDDYLIGYAPTGENVHAEIRAGTVLIAEDAFHIIPEMESVTIPNSVKYICNDAFWGCSALQSVVIPESVISIGYEAFGWCEALSSVVIPDNVQSMGSAVFRDCSGLISATIGSGVPSVPNGTFFNCKNLRTVKIAEGVTAIEATAFALCESLTEVVIPKSVTDISVESTFAYCDNVRIHCYRDSCAHLYAKENNIDFYLLGETSGGGGSSKPKQTVGLTNFKPANTYDNTFNDVAGDAWYRDSIKTAYELDLVKGAGEGKFNPDGNMTIAEAITLAVRLHSIYNTGKADFVQGDIWYQVYVDYAIEQSIITADQFTDYNASATRAEFAEIFAKAIAESDYNAINDIKAGDVPDVAENDAVYLLYNAGVVAGSDEAHSFLPESNIKRCEIATIITRIVYKEKRVTFSIVPSPSGEGGVA